MAERSASVSPTELALETPFDFVRSYGIDNVGTSFNPHVSWALRQLAGAERAIAEAEQAGNEQAITAAKREIKVVEEQNLVIFDKAAMYIAAKKEALFLQRIRIAADALDAGDTEKYAVAEELLHQTSPIDTQAVRERIAADAALNQ